MLWTKILGSYVALEVVAKTRCLAIWIGPLYFHFEWKTQSAQRACNPTAMFWYQHCSVHKHNNKIKVWYNTHTCCQIFEGFASHVPMSSSGFTWKSIAHEINNNNTHLSYMLHNLQKQQQSFCIIGYSSTQWVLYLFFGHLKHARPFLVASYYNPPLASVTKVNPNRIKNKRGLL